MPFLETLALLAKIAPPVIAAGKGYLDSNAINKTQRRNEKATAKANFINALSPRAQYQPNIRQPKESGLSRALGATQTGLGVYNAYQDAQRQQEMYGLQKQALQGQLADSAFNRDVSQGQLQGLAAAATPLIAGQRGRTQLSQAALAVPLPDPKAGPGTQQGRAFSTPRGTKAPQATPRLSGSVDPPPLNLSGIGRASYQATLGGQRNQQAQAQAAAQATAIQNQLQNTLSIYDAESRRINADAAATRATADILKQSQASTKPIDPKAWLVSVGQAFTAAQRGLADGQLTPNQALSQIQAKAKLAGVPLGSELAQEYLGAFQSFALRLPINSTQQRDIAGASQTQTMASRVIEMLADPAVSASVGKLAGAATRAKAWLSGQEFTPPEIVEFMAQVGLTMDEHTREQTGAALTPSETTFYSSLLGGQDVSAEAIEIRLTSLIRSLQDQKDAIALGALRQKYSGELINGQLPSHLMSSYRQVYGNPLDAIQAQLNRIGGP